MANKGAFDKFLQDNLKDNLKGPIGAIFGGLAVAQIAAADNKVKEFFKQLFSILLLKPMFSAFLAGSFGAMGRSVRSLVKDTGSLDAALKKLTQIQGMQRMFAPLLGGVEAAKKKVAELVNFAGRSPFQFGDVGEANRSLQVYTRGLYAGAGAMTTIGDAAAATGNGVTQTADAVGEFYATMREGQPIDAVTGRLQQMGVITDGTAERLIALQRNGGSLSEVFGTLTTALEAHSGGMASLATDVASVEAAYEKAKESLAEKFASPFVESDVENTQNMTDAMNAIAPVVESVSGFLEKLTNGFSTTSSWIAKTAAQSPLLAGALGIVTKVGAVLIGVVSAIAGLSLAGWLLSSAGAAAALVSGLIGLTGATGMAATAITALGVALRVAMIATGIGAIIAILVTAVGVYLNFAGASAKVAKEVRDLRKAHDETTAALLRQIAAADTLAAKHEAVVASLEAVAEAQTALNRLLANPDAKRPQLEEAVRNLNEKREVAEKAQARPATASTNEELASRAAAVEQARARTEQNWQNEFDQATPNRRAEMLAERSADRGARAERANVGNQARTTHSRAAAEAETRIAAAQQEYDLKRRDAAEAYQRTGQVRQMYVAPVTDARRELDRLKAERDALDAALPKDSSVYAEAQARKSQKPTDRSNWEWYAEQRRQEERNAGSLAVGAAQDQNDLGVMQREQRLTEQRAAWEREIAELKGIGPQHAEEEYRIRQKILAAELAAERSKQSPDRARIDAIEAERANLARRQQEQRREVSVDRSGLNRRIAEGRAGASGDNDSVVRLQNLDTFAQHYEQTRQLFGDTAEARKKAQSLTEYDIAANGAAPIASSLARIGLGGEFGGGTDVTKQIRDLTKDIAGYLQSIDTKTIPANGPSNTPQDYDGI